MRLTLVITSLELAGAERTVALLANAWAQRGEAVTVVIFDRVSPSYPLHPAVTECSLGVPNGSARNLAQAFSRNSTRVLRLRRAIRNSRPDAVISFMDYTNVVTLLATRGIRTPVIISEQANPDYVPMGALWEFLRRKLYPRATTLVCPTARMAERLEARLGVPGRGIPNPIQVPAGERSSTVATAPMLAAMGRLVAQKGFDRLLDAFSRIAGRHRQWSVAIVGKGPLRAELEAQAHSLNLAGRVKFLGELSDPFAALRASEFFVFPSRFEGFGIALAEAMACGLPAISFDCVAGPAEIIRDGIDGILVPPGDVHALAQAMDRLMSDAAERARLASRAPEVLTRFGLPKVLALWDALFSDILLSASKNTDMAAAAGKRTCGAAS